MRRNYEDKKVAFLFTLKNRAFVKTTEGELLRLLGNCLSTLSNVLEGFSFASIQFHFADFGSIDCDLMNELSKQIKVKSEFHIHSVEAQSFGRGPGFNYILDNIDCSDFHMVAFLDADMLFVREGVLATALSLTLERNQAFFPVCLRLTKEGPTKSPEFDGFGNAFVPASIMHTYKLRFINKHTWGEEDLYFFKEVEKRCPCIQSQVPGFYHQWHPKHNEK